ncbi:YdaU family protein [Cupriavidus phytorum]|nr:YdaU family protein [Cupriavidus alkaliphilus]
MNYFMWFHRDYAADTRGLSWTEDLALRRLLEIHYDAEHPLEPDIRSLCKRIGATTKLQRRAVADVLDRYFVQTPEGWVNHRVVQQIETQRAYRETKRANGMKGGRPRKEKNLPVSKGGNTDRATGKATGFDGTGFDGNLQETYSFPTKKPTAKPTTNYKQNNRVTDTSVVAREHLTVAHSTSSPSAVASADEAKSRLAGTGSPATAQQATAPDDQTPDPAGMVG